MAEIRQDRTQQKLHRALKKVENRFDLAQQVQNDPLGLVLQYREPQDQEIAAFIAAVFAYGNVKQIRKSVALVFELLGPNPHDTLMKSSGADWKNRIPRTFKHRFNTADDLGLLLTWLGQALRQSETLERFFFDNGKGTASFDLGSQIDSFVGRLSALPSAPYEKPKSKGALFFLPSPKNKSACKRILLFLRWAAGTGPMALGIWKTLSPADLIIPVDTHVLRISRHLGLTRRKDNSWRTALEISAALKQMTPHDPTRYDFALCHLGISQACPSRFKIEICHQCEMKGLCVTYGKKRNKTL